MVILIKAILVDAHEGEELWVDHLLCLQDAYLVREDLPEVGLHLLGLLIQRKEHLWLEIEQGPPFRLVLRKDILLESSLSESTNEEVLNQPIRVFLDT